ARQLRRRQQETLQIASLESASAASSCVTCSGFHACKGGCVVQRGNFWLPLVFLCLVGCEKQAPNSTSGASDPRRPGAVAVAGVSRQFLKIEPVGSTSAEGVRTYFGRTAFRPKALWALTA